MKSLNEILAQVNQFDDSYPVESWDPQHCGDIDMRIDRSGQWHHAGSPIKRDSLVKLFSKLIKKEGDEYFLVTPVEKIILRVEVFPFMAVLAEQKESEAGNAWVLTLNSGETIAISSQHPLHYDTEQTDEQKRLFIPFRKGLNIGIHRNVYYQIAQHCKSHVVGTHINYTIKSYGVQYVFGQEEVI